MPERAIVFERSQIGPEVTPGTAVAATRQLLGTRITSNIVSETNVTGPNGFRVATTGVQNKEHTEADIEQDPAQYTEMVYPLSGILGRGSVSVPSASVNLWEWDPSPTNPLTPQTFTVEEGGYVRAKRFAYGLVNSLSMEWSRDGVSLNGTMIGQRTTDGHTMTAGTAEVQTITASGTVSGGTYTISFEGHTTGSLAHSANNAAILAALELLPNIAPGDVTLGGGALPGTPVTVTFGGQYASSNVPMLVINSASLTGGGSYAVTQTTPGAPLTQAALQPVSGKDWDFYLETSLGSHGTTKLTRCFGGSFDLGEMYDVLWTGNTSNTSWAAHADIASEPTFSFTVETDATGEGYLTQLRAGQVVYPRIKFTGPTLGSSTYLAQFDFAVILTEPGDVSDEGGVQVREWSGRIIYDATWGKWMSVDVQNNVTALA